MKNRKLYKALFVVSGVLLALCTGCDQTQEAPPQQQPDPFKKFLAFARNAQFDADGNLLNEAEMDAMLQKETPSGQTEEPPVPIYEYEGGEECRGSVNIEIYCGIFQFENPNAAQGKINKLLLADYLKACRRIGAQSEKVAALREKDALKAYYRGEVRARTRVLANTPALFSAINEIYSHTGGGAHGGLTLEGFTWALDGAQVREVALAELFDEKLPWEEALVQTAKEIMKAKLGEGWDESAAEMLAISSFGVSDKALTLVFGTSPTFVGAFEPSAVDIPLKKLVGFKGLGGLAEQARAGN